MEYLADFSARLFHSGKSPKNRDFCAADPKNVRVSRHSSIRVAQVPSNKLNPGKQVLSWGRPQGTKQSSTTPIAEKVINGYEQNGILY